MEKREQYIALGFDIGGSSIKLALVDCSNGEILSDTKQVLLPSPSTPEYILKIIANEGAELNWTGPIGVGFPGVVKSGQTITATHLGDSWIKFDFLTALKKLHFSSVSLLNDADAAGICEMNYGAGSKSLYSKKGTVLLLTFGTGIGSALFKDGHLIPNTELGHIELNGADAEETAAASVKTNLGLSWSSYTERLNIYIEAVSKLVSLDLIILGGGISENFTEFESLLTTSVKIIAAEFKNNAGLIGAALEANESNR